MMNETNISPHCFNDRIRGCMIGGAIGDALGYPVEFLSRKEILRKYGSKGISTFQELNDRGKAVISDDTQMTLFTANGLLFGVTRFCTHGILGAGLDDFVAYAYQDWLQTQIGVDDYYAYHYCWIRDIKELNVRRAPGNTCLSALISIKNKVPVENDSKGCGGIMRVAPVGLMAAADNTIMVKGITGKEIPRRIWSKKEVVRLGGDCAEITHKHPLGYLPAAFLSDIVYNILMSEMRISFSELESIVWEVYDDVKNEYKTEREQKDLEELKRLLDKAIRLACNINISDAEAIRLLGEGWTGDEALAIAVFCALKHVDSFEEAIICAVNHDGDSDSTGAICGNIMGAIVGYENIPNKFTSKLELASLIIDMADDIVRGCPINEYHMAATDDEQIWEQRYIDILPVKQKSLGTITEYYSLMPPAQREISVRNLFSRLDSAETETIRDEIAYNIALQVFNIDFHPDIPLKNKSIGEPPKYFMKRDSMPVYTYGFSEDQPVCFRTFFGKTIRINVSIISEMGMPVIGIRSDSHPCPVIIHSGMKPYYNPEIVSRYPLWSFFELDFMKVKFAFCTVNLEKEIVFEVAHLQSDGSLKRIYSRFE